MSLPLRGRHRDAAAFVAAGVLVLAPLAGAQAAGTATDDQAGTQAAAAAPPGVAPADLPDWVTITNGTVTLGVWSTGELNVPAGAASSGGTTDVGLRFVPTGHEATAIGCRCEGWGAADATSGVSGFTDRELGLPANLRVESFTATSDTAVSTVVIGDGAGADVLRVEHHYHPSSTPNLYEVRVTITNLGAAPVDPRYRRVTDWDAQPTAGAEWMTLQGVDAAADVRFASNDGLASADPLAGPSDLGWVGDFEDQGPMDHGSLFDLGFAPIAPAGSRSFTTYYGAAATEAAAGTAVAAVGAAAYAFAQPDTSTGPAAGSPNTFIYAVGGAAPAPAKQVERWDGADRYAVAATVARQWDPGVPVVYIASGVVFPDALSGGALAGHTDAPLLLVKDSVIPRVTAEALDRLRPARIVILGGPVTVSPAVAEQLAGYATAQTADAVTRFTGADRYAVARAVAAEFGTDVPVVYVAKGTDFPDALAGGARAGLEGGPVLLTRPGSLPGATRAALTAAAPDRIVVLGGTDSVEPAVAAELESYTAGPVTRHEGTDRYDVAALVAAGYDAPVPVVFVATGEKFPDALSSVPAAVRLRGPILLTKPLVVPSRTAQALERLNPARIVVLGGTESVSADVQEMLRTYLD